MASGKTIKGRVCILFWLQHFTKDVIPMDLRLLLLIGTERMTRCRTFELIVATAPMVSALKKREKKKNLRGILMTLYLN